MTSLSCKTLLVVNNVKFNVAHEVKPIIVILVGGGGMLCRWMSFP